MTNSSSLSSTALLWPAVRSALPWPGSLAAVAAVLTYFALSLMPATYCAEATIAVPGAIERHMSALRAPALVGAVAGRLPLAKGKDGSPDASASVEAAGVQSFLDRLEVLPGRTERQIAVRFSARDPDVAAAAANALVEAYRAELAHRRDKEPTAAETEGERNLARLADELKAAEAEVARLAQAAAGTAGAPDRVGTAAAASGPLAAELARAKAAREEAEGKLANAREAVRSGRAESLAEVQSVPIVRTLVEQRVRLERQIHELSATLLPAHPRMRQLNADLKGLKQQIEAEVRSVTDALAKEAKAAGEREDRARKELEATQAKVVEQGRDAGLAKQQEAALAAKRAEVVRLENEIAAARKLAATRAAPVVEARIVTPATAASAQVSSRKGPFTALIAAAVFMLGLAFAIARAVLARGHGQVRGHRRSSRGEVERGEAGVGGRQEPVLPVVAGRSSPVREPIVPEAVGDELVVRSVEELAELLLERAKVGTGFRTLVTGTALSAVAADQALALAEAMAAAGAEVLVVDWTADGEGLARALGWSEQAGLAELIDGSASFERAIRRVPGSRVHALVAGSDLPAYPGAIDTDRLNLILDALDEVYDQIVVTGRHGEARMLFEAIEGRFDAGVTVGAARRDEPRKGAARTFLGFDVDGLLVVQFETAVAKSSPIARLAHKRNPERVPA